jgi:hypothetical protein
MSGTKGNPPAGGISGVLRQQRALVVSVPTTVLDPVRAQEPLLRCLPGTRTVQAHLLRGIPRIYVTEVKL